MQFALMTEPQLGGTYEQQLAAARFAESEGLVAFARSDHYLANSGPAADATDAFATLAGLARETSRIRLCVLVSPITFRHPAVIAKLAATIDLMSGGRLDLGMGTGWSEVEHRAFGLDFPPLAERFDRLQEALGYVAAALEGTGREFTGHHYRLEAVPVLPAPVGKVPIIVGGTGSDRTPRLAGTYCDEYNHFSGPPEVIGPKIERVREAATAAGRDPAAITVSVMGPVLVGRDQQSFRERVASAAARRGCTPEEHEQHMRSFGVPVGTAPEVRETLGRLSEIGVSKMYVQHFDVSDLSTLGEDLEILRG